ncbi:MAG: NAD(P)H-hydrate dehydratase [Williamsia sp.]|nr:NAD(P)H-hydrate dehydratase [Williamsia sp.]
MELLSSAQIKEWDAFTCSRQGISSLELMERAATACLDWLELHGYLPRELFIFCGKGNNGGDGLALARLLKEKGAAGVGVFILETPAKPSADFSANLQRLQQTGVPVQYIRDANGLPTLEKSGVLIDALFGSGLNRPLEGWAAELTAWINGLGMETIAIDLPSGMFADKSSIGHPVVRARHTVSFQIPKLAFLVAENEPLTGSVHILDIGLDAGFLETVYSPFETVHAAIIRLLYKPRKAFSHKGSFGHALLIAGSYGKIGAAVLSAKACLRSGVGLLSCYIPRCGYPILQTAVPEAMTYTDENREFTTAIKTDLTKFGALGIGPGLGTEEATAKALLDVLSTYKKPLVLDADALNIIARQPDGLASLPPFSILTPHPKEFERLFGASSNDFEKLELAVRKAKDLSVIIVLKGHHTFIAMPGGKGYFNTTGNAGMATGGSGDVLTGFLTGLLAQNYTPATAALLGVYLHGLAGDKAASIHSQEAMVAQDIIEGIGPAFQEIGAGK